MSYVHPDDRNLTNLHKAMEYDASGKPVIRTSIAGGNVVITGDVTIPGEVTVNSTESDPVHTHVSEVGTSGILTTPYLPVGGNVTISNIPNVRVTSGNITVQQGTNPWTVIGNVNVVSGTSNVTISNLGNSSIATTLADGGQLGAFSRLRTANASNINEYKNVYGLTADWEFSTSTGGSGSLSYNVNASTTGLSVGTSGSDYVVYQTREYHSYTPGCGQLIMATGVLAPSKPNLTQRIGYFDDRDGIFFERSTNAGNVTVETWNIRNSNGGSPTIAQSAVRGSWNIDNFDGTGPSGIAINWNTAQIWFIDFQWLGVGRVRCGFDLDGVLYYAHEFLNANSVTSTYMGLPSLPVRYEIRNTGTTSGTSTMTMICAAVQTEGGTQTNVWRYATTTDGTGIVCGTAERCVIALRLKNSLNGVPNRAQAQLADFNMFATQQTSYRILLCSNSTVLSGSPTWTSVDPTSYTEYTTNVAVQNLNGNSICINAGFVSTAQGSASGSLAGLLQGSKNAIHQNYGSTDSQIIIITGQRIGNQDTTVYAALNWLEID